MLPVLVGLLWFSYAQVQSTSNQQCSRDSVLESLYSSWKWSEVLRTWARNAWRRIQGSLRVLKSAVWVLLEFLVIFFSAQRTKPLRLRGRVRERVWEKGKFKVPKDTKRRQDPCGELTTAKLKRLGRRGIDEDNQTGDCKWINIERREQRLNWKGAGDMLGLLHFFLVHTRQVKGWRLIRIFDRERKAGLVGLDADLVWIFSIYSGSGRITFFFPLQITWSEMQDSYFYLCYPPCSRAPALPVLSVRHQRKYKAQKSAISYCPCGCSSLARPVYYWPAVNTLFSASHCRMVW